jgi:hypothetical protein
MQVKYLDSSLDAEIAPVGAGASLVAASPAPPA